MSMICFIQVDVGDVPKQRESWMTELPEDMGARFGLGNRQFRKGEAAEIDSSWTETPQDKADKKVEACLVIEEVKC